MQYAAATLPTQRSSVCAYANSKEQELIAAGRTPEEAAAYIAENYVGIRSSGTREGLCVNPSVLPDIGQIYDLKQRAQGLDQEDGTKVSFTDQLEKSERAIKPQTIVDQKAQRTGWAKSID